MSWSVVVVGPIGAGKTSLVQRLAYGSTLNSDSTVAPMCYRMPNLTLWDTPGDDRYSWSYEPLLQRCDLVLYCISPEGSDARSYAGLTPAPVLVVHTKSDTTDARHGRDTSAVTGEGCSELLAEIQATLTREAPAATPPPAELKPKKGRCC